MENTMPDKTKYTHGSDTPLPHILYSAESECGFLSHLDICFKVFGLVELPVTLR